VTASPTRSSRLERERDFHDREFASNAPRPADRFYALTGRAFREYEARLMGRAPGRVLEYGCGPGSYAFRLTEQGCEVTGIDISPVGVRAAEERAKRENRTGCTFRVMNAEKLAFPDDAFDLICGTGILHHLDLQLAFGEVARTLKPDGAAWFLEPLGHNPAVNLYRRLTPAQRTPDEHPLLLADLRLAGIYFERVETRYFNLLSLLAQLIPGGAGRLRALAVLDRLDVGLLKYVSPLRRLAWIVVVGLSGPHPAPRESPHELTSKQA
jgi:SAM-dependent methyltransferase